VQRTEAPVERSVTVTTVPKAKLGLAQVPAGAPYHDAWPVVVLRGAGGGGGATGLAATTTGLGAGATGGAGFGAGGADGFGAGGVVVVVVVGNTCRNDTFTTRVCGPVSTPVGVECFVATPAPWRAVVAKSAKATGVVHDVDSCANDACERTRPSPAPL
jgi:hypothetical protein